MVCASRPASRSSAVALCVGASTTTCRPAACWAAAAACRAVVLPNPAGATRVRTDGPAPHSTRTASAWSSPRTLALALRWPLRRLRSRPPGRVSQSAGGGGRGVGPRRRGARRLTTRPVAAARRRVPGGPPARSARTAATGRRSRRRCSRPPDMPAIRSTTWASVNRESVAHNPVSGSTSAANMSASSGFLRSRWRPMRRSSTAGPG